MRFLSVALGTGIAFALLAGCSANGSLSGALSSGGNGTIPQAGHHLLPLAAVPKSLIRYAPFRGVTAPQSATRGIYVNEFYMTNNNVIGFPKNEVNNGPPICSESTGANVNDLSTDGKGNLLIPNAFSGLQIYQGPQMCGPLIYTLNDPYGQASSAAANDALNGPIVVGQIGGGTTTGVAVCTVSSGTCKTLSSPNMSSLAAVAMDKAGNCYADAFDSSGHVGLWYYAGCNTGGVELGSANGFNEPYYGGLSVDNRGNIVVVSLFNASFTTPSTVTVYSGCITGTCTVVGGPFNVNGESIFGHLGRQNQRWVTINISTSMVEVYAYTGHGTGLTYLYSFNNGLQCPTYLCETAAYSPASPRV